MRVSLSQPLVFSQPENGETLFFYLGVYAEAVSAAFIRETPDEKKPVYLMSKALQGPEVRYQQTEKVSLSLVNVARRLRH